MSFFKLIYFVFVILAGCGTFQRSGSYNSQGTYNPQEAPHSPHTYKSPYKTPNNRNPLHLVWPVEKIRVSQEFAPADNPYHQGLDLTGNRKTSIYSAHSGLVVYAGNGFRGYGKMLIVKYNKTWATLYGHLNKLYVKSGDWIKSGQVVGKMGRTGRATGVHLHFELLRFKQPVDPLRFLPPRHQFTKQ